MTGVTRSPTFPTTKDAYDPTQNSDADVFVLKLNHNASDLIYSTYVGGKSDDLGRDITIDDMGNAYIIGFSESSDFPTTDDAFNRTLLGRNDAIFFGINHNGSELIYSTYFGGTGGEDGRDIAIDSNLNLYLVGMTSSNDLPNTTGAYDTTLNGYSDIFVAKFKIRNIFNITSVSLLKDKVSTSTVYSRNGYYTFRINFFHNADQSNLGVVTLRLDPDGQDIILQWDSSTGKFQEISDPNNLITIHNSSKAFNNRSKWTVKFNIIFNWTYPHEDLNDIQIYATSYKLPTAWLNASGFFQVENDLVFSGSLYVFGEDDRIINENDLVRGGEILNWSGLSVVYEGTYDEYPPSEEYAITIWDENLDCWSGSTLEGEECDIGTITCNLTNTDGYNYTINISGIPPECDATDETFTVKIDGDNVSFSNPTPTEESWQTSKNILAGVTISDLGGSEVEGSTILRAVSINNGSSWSNWESAKKTGLSESITVQNEVKLAEGTENLIKWQASDSLGNGPQESEEFRIRVDTKEVSFSDFWPLTNVVSLTEEVNTGITITDTTSGVNASSIEYSISNNGGEDWNPWTKVNGYNDGLKIKIDINITFENGTKNRLKMRAYDLAGNGPTESYTHPIIVDIWVPPIKPKVILLSPPIGMSLNKSSAQLTWELENSTMENVVYDLYFDNVTPPHIQEKDILTLNYTIDNLKDGDTYYWRVIPKLNDIEGTCLSDIFWFKVELTVVEKNYALSITGRDSISMYPGENESIELTITNLGSHEDIIKLDLQAGEVTNYVQIIDDSMLTLAKDIDGKRNVKISLPKTIQPGNHTITITAISMYSGELVKEHINISLKIKKPDEPNTKPNGTSCEPESESNDLLLFIIIGIIVAVVICLVVIGVIKKRKKRLAPETLPGYSITTRPQPLTGFNIGESPPPIEPVVQTQVPPHPTPQFNLPTPQQQTIPTIATPETHSTPTIDQTPSIAIPSVAQKPQLPPAQIPPVDKKPELELPDDTQPYVSDQSHTTTPGQSQPTVQEPPQATNTESQISDQTQQINQLTTSGEPTSQPKIHESLETEKQLNNQNQNDGSTQ